jgi:hypothetical protein
MGTSVSPWLSATLGAGELVELLNFVFTTFDDALEAGGALTVCS